MWTRLLPAILLLFALGCSEPEGPAVESDRAGSETEEPATMPEPEPIEGSTVMMIDETESPSLLDSATLRKSGATEASGEEESFEVGDQLEMVVRVKEVPPALAAWVYWIGPDGSRIAEEQKPVPDEGVVILPVDTGDWAPGAYTAEVYIGGDLVETRNFMIETNEKQSN